MFLLWSWGIEIEASFFLFVFVIMVIVIAVLSSPSRLNGGWARLDINLKKKNRGERENKKNIRQESKT
jgi:hypothetical protein